MTQPALSMQIKELEAELGILSAHHCLLLTLVSLIHLKAVHERLRDPTARGFGTPRTDVDHKNLLHVTPSFVRVTDERI